MNEKWILYDKHHPPWHTSAVKHKLLCDVTTSDNIDIVVTSSFSWLTSWFEPVCDLRNSKDPYICA